MENIYQEREQTEAKHFILQKYLQKLAFKILQGGLETISYIDGFSGPWQSRTPDHSDSSFMIAINVLKDAQANVRISGKRPRIRCFFVEENNEAFAKLQAAVIPHHDPANGFIIETFNGKFENAVSHIQRFMANSFAITFIDPTGWTGYEFVKVKPIFEHSPGEVLLNFMYAFVNRFTASPNPAISVSFDGILGENWKTELAASPLSREEALTNLFREQFGKAGGFKYVLSTPIEKISDRTHFYIVYGTRSKNGLAAYREVEYKALKDHGMRRAAAREIIRENKTLHNDLFGPAVSASMAGLSMEAQIADIRGFAKDWLRDQLTNGPKPFSEIWPAMLEQFMLRETDAKRICAELGKDGVIKETWRLNGSRRRVPNDDDIIEYA